jgi:hypothetical protein
MTGCTAYKRKAEEPLADKGIPLVAAGGDRASQLLRELEGWD